MTAQERIQLTKAVSLLESGRVKDARTRLKRLLKLADDEAKDRHVQRVLSGLLM